MNKLLVILSFMLMACTSNFAEAELLTKYSKPVNLEKSPMQCGQKGVWLQVLGSGGPEIDDKRASTGYLIWVDGESKVLIDAGGGSAANFEQVGAKFEQLDMILLSHLHVDHASDLPVYIKGSYFGSRTQNLTILGPQGNRLVPATDEYVNRLFNKNQGAYEYLGDFLPNENLRPAQYLIEAQVYSEPFKNQDDSIEATAVSVRHGPIPALAWRLDINETSIMFSGDMGSGQSDFIDLLKNVDLFVAHNAIPETARGGIRNLHMRPSLIGEYAKRATVKSLVLSHRMNRTLGVEQSTLDNIRKSYSQSINFANDLDCFEIN